MNQFASLEHRRQLKVGGFYGTYRAGDIARWRDKWGVCVGYKFAGVPLWDWFDEDGIFIDQQGSSDRDISAPYPENWPFPDTVLARSFAAKLTENI